jgi:iron complex transport system substrate-binding protein
VLGCVAAQAEERVVSGAGAITETVYAIGADKALVGVDLSSVYPTEAAKLAQVGYARQLSAEGILSVQPTILLVSEDGGPAAVIEQIEKAGVKVVKLESAHTPEAAVERIRNVGAALNQATEAEKVANELSTDLAGVKKQLEGTTQRPKVLFLMAHGGGTMNVAGRGTAADAVIALAGGVNAVKDYDGYKPLTAEAAVAAAPDYILTTTRAIGGAGGVEGLLKLPGLDLTPAGRNAKVIVMDDLYLLGFGPRMGKATQELFTQLHPPAQTALK